VKVSQIWNLIAPVTGTQEWHLRDKEKKKLNKIAKFVYFDFLFIYFFKLRSSIEDLEINYKLSKKLHSFQ
jgi:hypothetical protein